MLAVLSSKGQITIPAHIRILLQLKTGDTVDFVMINDERVELIPAKTPVSALKSMVEKPAKPVTLEEMDAARGQGGER